MLTVEEETLVKLERASARVTASGSFLRHLNLRRMLSRRYLRRFARDHTLALGKELRPLLVSVQGERNSRIAKRHLSAIMLLLGLGDLDARAMTLADVHHLTSYVYESLRAVAEIGRMLERGPRPDAAFSAARDGALSSHLEETSAAIRRCEARRESYTALDALGSWFGDAWRSACRSAIAAGQSNTGRIGAVVNALPTVEAFQEFRRRTAAIDEFSMSVFQQLRLVSAELAALPGHELASMVRRIIAREARLAMKARLEASKPALLFDQMDTVSKVQGLGAADREFRRLNSRLLAEGVDAGKVQGRQQVWTSVTRLRTGGGVSRSSIRDLIENGRDLGLFELRPVWMTNPDVASRILPLTPGLFDVVVFDEASQMPVEYALPALFRAGLAIVSGDEKQMPPTSFFASRVDDDEEDDSGDADLDGLSESAREALDETWNRREIKDCPDLLNLARVSLPSKTLEVHYRSAYRELIAFSNAAFYGNRLNVPVHHPKEIVRRDRPIEVIQVDGTYTQQTNPAEADRVVELLATYWTMPQEQRPSIGVVTFNRKQADLIEDRLEARAEDDVDFRRAYIEEQQRTQDHEDIGFFVKNVENVQGDERDLIIFSTTFGRNERDVFRRNFGVLGQQGGRRRLNVAVTRAKKKVIVATSIPISEVSDMLSTHRPPATGHGARLSAGLSRVQSCHQHTGAGCGGRSVRPHGYRGCEIRKAAASGSRRICAVC